MTTDEQPQQPAETQAALSDERLAEIRQDALPEDCPHQDAVFWNPYTHCVQCHRCGGIFAPWDYQTALPESVTPRLDVYAQPVPVAREAALLPGVSASPNIPALPAARIHEEDE